MLHLGVEFAGRGIGYTYLISLLQDHTALAVADDSPVNLVITELLNAYLAGESTVVLQIAVLRGDLDVLAQGVRNREQVEGWRGNNDLCNPAVCEPLSQGKIRENVAPTDGSIVALLRTSTRAFFASKETGFILKLPPTKN